ncbi:MAG: DNA recombination protein RmuC [Candidatus Aminicenantes bacterium]|nr:DNA recombination protein RmuC [Candidatus Aminicenantes bacterium]
MSLPLALALFGALAVVLTFVLWLLFRVQAAKLEEIRRDRTENQALALMQQQIGHLSQAVNQQVQAVNDQILRTTALVAEQMQAMSGQLVKTTGTIGQQIQTMQSQFRETTGQIGQNLGEVKSHLGKVEVVTREVLEKSRNIAALEDLLRAPKFRGGMGELFLGDLLQQILPPANYELQYKFKSGETVDAVVKIGANLVPIDSKFPLENFRKFVQEEGEREKAAHRKKFAADVRRHVDAIAAKYILPDEGTYAFALMYVPAENIYYETIIRDEAFGEEKSLYGYALQKKVIPVSPNSFYAYLQVIVLGLKGLQVEKSAKEILQSLSRLGGDLARFQGDFDLVGTHLGNARSKYEDAEKRLGKIADKVEKLGGGQAAAALPEGGTTAAAEEAGRDDGRS